MKHYGLTLQFSIKIIERYTMKIICYIFVYPLHETFEIANTFLITT